MTHRVSSVECDSYDLDRVHSAVEAALARLAFPLPRNETVLVKPNVMSQNTPEQHTVTHFAVVDALCRLLSDQGCRIRIGDSEAFFEAGLTRKAFRTTRLAQVAARYGAELVPFEEQPLVSVPTELDWLPTIHLPRAVLEADAVINAGKLKSHSGLRLSGALKNMFGCVPGGYKQRIHAWSRNDFELSDVFCELHRIVRPSLSVLDAVVSLDGGPAAIGRPVRTGRILASTNAAALDVVACRMIGYEPDEVTTLQRARARGLIGGFDEVEVLGTVESVPFRRLVRGPLATAKKGDGLFVTATYVDVRVNARCTACWACLDSCPVGAIAAGETRAHVDGSSCINCYHCLTVCPYGAIGILASAMNRVVRAVRLVTRL